MSIAPGETGGMPLAISSRLYDIGPVIDGQGTAAIYADRHAVPASDDIPIVRDLAYGPHQRHVLDIAARQPGASDEQRPVVVFIHGGGFSRGQKSAPDSPYYDNVLRWAAENGLVGVAANYRLAPEFQWPAGIEDLIRLGEWLAADIANFGGDPDQIVFWGHSAGAAHVGDYIADCVGRGLAHGLAGAVLTSGFFQLEPDNPTWAVYYGDDVSQYPERSALGRLVTAELPLFVNDAELDPPGFSPQSRQLVAGRRAAGTPVEYLHLQGHSHISELYAVGTDDVSLTAPVLAFIERLAQQE
jgi:triacylglycerol lipase